MGVLQNGPRLPPVRALLLFHSHLSNKPQESQLNLNKIKYTISIHLITILILRLASAAAHSPKTLQVN